MDVKSELAQLEEKHEAYGYTHDGNFLCQCDTAKRIRFLANFVDMKTRHQMRSEK